jgi:hypothetical protein
MHTANDSYCRQGPRSDQKESDQTGSGSAKLMLNIPNYVMDFYVAAFILHRGTVSLTNTCNIELTWILRLKLRFPINFLEHVQKKLKPSFKKTFN